MHERLFGFLTNHKYIYHLQFGCQTGHSTNHALLDLIDDIRKAIDNNKFAVGVFIDLQKAFDTTTPSSKKNFIIMESAGLPRAGLSPIGQIVNSLFQ